ncbi:MAG: hypothetical protein ACR2JO_07905 [Mycobacteriales bacterium]
MTTAAVLASVALVTALFALFIAVLALDVARLAREQLTRAQLDAAVEKMRARLRVVDGLDAASNRWPGPDGGDTA